MMNASVRVLVVDDSAFMRRAIARMLKADPAFEIVGYGANGKEAIAQVAQLSPDVVLLDIEMPVMDGLTALRHLKRDTAVPVVMMSALTQAGAQITIEALDAGAFEFIPKPSSLVDIFGTAQELMAKLKAAAGSRRHARRTPDRPPAASPPPSPGSSRPQGSPVDLVAIGISTGGPRALQDLLGALPTDFPAPIIIVQHMPVGFTEALARRLDQICAITVREAAHGDSLAAGTALIAKAGFHLVVKAMAAGPRVQLLEDSETHTWHKPSVNVMMASLASSHGPRALGLVMTGMGTDGLVGARAMKESGAEIWAQDEESSVVYGMPRAVFEAGLADRVLPLSRISAELNRRCARSGNLC